MLERRIPQTLYCPLLKKKWSGSFEIGNTRSYRLKECSEILRVHKWIVRNTTYKKLFLKINVYQPLISGHYRVIIYENVHVEKGKGKGSSSHPLKNIITINPGEIVTFHKASFRNFAHKCMTINWVEKEDTNTKIFDLNFKKPVLGIKVNLNHLQYQCKI